MGLPVLTCKGEAFAGRVAATLLHAVGIPELITSNLEDYQTLALKLARDAALLAEIKAKLVGHRNTYPLFDTVRFTRHIEAAYMTMCETWQRGEAPKSFSVEPIDLGGSVGVAASPVSEISRHSCLGMASLHRLDSEMAINSPTAGPTENLPDCANAYAIALQAALPKDQ